MTSCLGEHLIDTWGAEPAPLLSGNDMTQRSLGKKVVTAVCGSERTRKGPEGCCLGDSLLAPVWLGMRSLRRNGQPRRAAPEGQAASGCQWRVRPCGPSRMGLSRDTEGWLWRQTWSAGPTGPLRAKSGKTSLAPRTMEATTEPDLQCCVRMSTCDKPLKRGHDDGCVGSQPGEPEDL